jgi:hypothetical protein
MVWLLRLVVKAAAPLSAFCWSGLGSSDRKDINAELGATADVAVAAEKFATVY